VKLDQPSISQLGAASEKAIPDLNDGVLNILPVVFPHIPLITPTQPGPGTPAEQTTSFIASSLVSRINQVSTTVLVATLARGLWRINWSHSHWSNFNHTGIQADGTLTLLMGVNSRVFSQLFNSTNNPMTNSGSFVILLRETAIIQLSGGTAGVGEELQTIGMIQAEKLI
jgi:hypothetical protein